MSDTLPDPYDSGPPDPYLYIPGVEADHATDGPLYRQRLIGQVLGEILVANGGVADWPMTGPQLLAFAHEMRDRR